MMRVARAALAAFSLAFVLAGCGVKGGLETPPAAKSQTTADAQSGEGRPAGAAPKPHKSSVLDGLIR